MTDDREAYICEHWAWHRLAAKGMLAYDEAALLADEWTVLGGLPPDAAEAIALGRRDLTPWCPTLSGVTLPDE